MILKKHIVSIGFILLFLISVSRVLAYQNPTVISFDPTQYQGANQIWKVDQLENGDYVFANNDGLLIFNGEQWKSFLTGKTEVRSVRTMGNHIFSGGYMDFGYWHEINTGDFKYISLVDSMNLKLIRDEHIWNIIHFGDEIIFQSLKQLHIYNYVEKSIRSIKPHAGINKIFHLNDLIYFQDFDQNINTLNAEGYDLFYPGSSLPESEILNMYYTDEGIRIFTKEHGFFQYRDRKFLPWQIRDSELLQLGDFFSAIQLKSGMLALGSITRGVFILSDEGELVHHLNQLNGLNNNTVLSMLEDQRGNLVLGLDNGMSIVHLESMFKEYIDKAGVLGTVYTSKVHNEFLYLGTNQGLFYKQLNSNDDFKLVKNANGQIWSLFEYDNTLFCGHNLGTFIIEKDIARRISSVLGTWKFLRIPSEPGYLLQGNYEGIHLLKKSGYDWEYAGKMLGFDYSARQFILKDSIIYLYHFSKGLLKLHLDIGSKKIIESEVLKKTRPTNIANILKINDQIIFSDYDGLYKYDPKLDSLISLKTRARNEEFLNEAYKLTSAEDASFWMISDSEVKSLYLYGKDSLLVGENLRLNKAYFKTKDEYENISILGKDEYLIGMTNGYLVLELKKAIKKRKDYQVELTSIKLSEDANEAKVDIDEVSVFNNSENNLFFFYSVTGRLKYEDIQYRYILEGENSEWSEWSPQSEKAFYKLSPDKYTFKVEAKVGHILSNNIAEYSFRIKAPWYWNTSSKVLYFLLLVLTAILVNYFYSRVYEKRQEGLINRANDEMHMLKLENEQEMMLIQNQKLSGEIEAKNKELAVTAMSLVKKNEFLIIIKEKINKAGLNDDKGKRMLLRSINNEIENEESWEILKGAFENVDKGFISKVVEMHPGLTPSDLKLCTYLRLNLNSKEIATLLNISVRSMETKRYRLRKKLKIEHKTNLVEYILSI